MDRAKVVPLDPEAGRSARRLQQHRALEEQLADLRPDPNEALELLDALMAGLTKRYPDQLQDVEDCAKDLRDALTEADGIPG
jgi:hypothetical protein